MEIDQFTVAWLRQALKQRCEFVDQSQALGQHLRSYGGAPAAVEAIENWNG